MGISSPNGAGLWNSDNNAGELVLITLGGGHYAPRANKLASMDGVWLGHMLATYALPFEKSEDEHQQPGGTWKQSIDSALDATKKAFPNGKSSVLWIKSLQGWQRQAIRDHLAEVNIPLLTTKQIIEC